jgi:hypothetical protein
MRGGRVHGTPTTARRAKRARDGRCLHARKMTWSRGGARVNSLAERARPTPPPAVSYNVFVPTLETRKKKKENCVRTSGKQHDEYVVLWLWHEKVSIVTVRVRRIHICMAWPIQVIDKWVSRDWKKSPLHVRSLFDDISEYEKGFTDFVGQSQLSTIQHRAAQLIAQRTCAFGRDSDFFFKEMFGSRFFF